MKSVRAELLPARTIIDVAQALPSPIFHAMMIETVGSIREEIKAQAHGGRDER